MRKKYFKTLIIITRNIAFPVKVQREGSMLNAAEEVEIS